MENNIPKDSSFQNLGFQIRIIGDALKQNKILTEAIEYFRLSVIPSRDALDVTLTQEEAESTHFYLLEEFEGEFFTNLQETKEKVLGPLALMQWAKLHVDFTTMYYSIRRPLYCLAMRNIAVTFAGFQSKEELSNLARLVHYMDGSVRREFSINKTTHLVATPAAMFGEKYEYAASVGIPVMAKEWIYQVWAKRHDIKCNAFDPEFKQYRHLPLVGCKVAFLGQSEDHQHMMEETIKNGGELVDAKDPSCTHIIVADDHRIVRSEYQEKVHILKHAWFWDCIQMEARASESLYVYEDKIKMGFYCSSVTIPKEGNKQEIMESIAYQLAKGIEDFQSTDSVDGGELTWSQPSSMRTLSPRRQVCMELFQTEGNYVRILHTIITVFKTPLENPSFVDNPLLPPADIKIIFGNLPPIYQVHVKIHTQLTDFIYSKKDSSIGNIILSHVDELMKSYPPYVNFLEKSKERLSFCDATRPRFHAFLKYCQSKPECGRQELRELLIRPVQRLPSIILLLTEIYKHTSTSHLDHKALEKAIQALKSVMLHINEDKRKTEGQVEMFNIIHDIQYCPANLLSAHRTLISSTDVFEITDSISKRGKPLTVFLFTDVLEICRRRHREFGSARSESSLRPETKSHSKPPYKHLNLISLSHIRRVVNITETQDCANAFAIVFWCTKESKELLYAFYLDDTCKIEFLRSLCQQIAHCLCKTDANYLLTCLSPQQLNLNTAGIKSNTLKKALNKTFSKFGSTTSLKSTSLKLSISKGITNFFESLRNIGSSSNTMANLQAASFADLTVIEEPKCSYLTPPVDERRKSGSFGGFTINI